MEKVSNHIKEVKLFRILKNENCIAYQEYDAPKISSEIRISKPGYPLFTKYLKEEDISKMIKNGLLDEDYVTLIIENETLVSDFFYAYKVGEKYIPTILFENGDYLEGKLNNENFYKNKTFISVVFTVAFWMAICVMLYILGRIIS